jgi:hypothetical protein
LTDSQATEASARLEIAKSLAARVEADAAALRLGDGWKVELMQRLLSLPSSQLKALASDASGSYSQLMGAVKSATAAARSDVHLKSLGSANQDLVFYPITPCRNADTRNAGGNIAGGTFRDFDADLGSAQGGSAGCYVVPSRDAAAWALNVTVVNMTTTGFVAVRSVGSSNLTSLVNYPGPGQQVNNFAIVQNSRASGKEYEIYAASTVDVIVELFGYFVSPAATALDCVYTSAGTADAGAGGAITAMSPSCAVGYTIVGGVCQSPSSYVARLSGSRPSGSSWWCDYTNQSGGTLTFSAQARCCRVPGF